MQSVQNPQMQCLLSYKAQILHYSVNPCLSLLVLKGFVYESAKGKLLFFYYSSI